MRSLHLPVFLLLYQQPEFRILAEGSMIQEIINLLPDRRELFEFILILLLNLTNP